MASRTDAGGDATASQNFAIKVLADTSRTQSSRPDQVNDLDEMSRMQQENKSILNDYIRMHPITLKFSNDLVEKDYQAFSEKKRKFTVLTLYGVLSVLIQYMALLDTSYGALYNSTRLIVFELAACICFVSFLNRLVACFMPRVHPWAKGYGYIKNTVPAVYPAATMAASKKGPAEVVIPNDTYILFVVVGGVVIVDLLTRDKGDDMSSCETGIIFVMGFGTTALAQFPWLIATLLFMAITGCFLYLDGQLFSLNLMTLLAGDVLFTYSLVINEISLRRDFRLTRRLAAETVDVKFDMTTRALFEKGKNSTALGQGRESNSAASTSLIKYSDLVIGDLLGCGSFGEVHAATWQGTQVATKRIYGVGLEKAIVDFGKEAAIMETLRHPNIVLYLGTCMKPLTMVLELMPRGSLFNIIHCEKQELDWSLRFKMLVESARGMNFLHCLKNPIHHNDLKTLNILVDTDWRSKICDFGFSDMREIVKRSTLTGSTTPATKQADPCAIPEEEDFSSDDEGTVPPPDATSEPSNPATVATVGWASPESLEHEPLTEKNDVFSFGVVIFELLTLSVPYATVAREAIPLAVIGGKRPTDYYDMKQLLLDNAANEQRQEAMKRLISLMKRCWHQVPGNRPSFQEVIKDLDSAMQTFFGPEAYKNWQDHVVFPKKVNKLASADPIDDMDTSSFEIDPSTLQMGPKIGSGAYGEVYEAVYHGTHVAVKQFHNTGLPSAVIREFHKECKLMLGLRHPNVVLFMGSCTKPPKLVIVTELLTRGSLYYTYTHVEKPSNSQKHMAMLLKIAEGMALGLNYLHNHSPPIIHRDLKSPNVLLDDNWNAKIADFGLSRIREEGKVMTSVGSPLWAAPEVLRGELSGLPSDVYGFGVVVWEILKWKEPYPGLSSNSIMRQVAFNKLRPKLSSRCPVGLKKLLQSCWLDRPEERPTFQQIINTLASASTSPDFQLAL